MALDPNTDTTTAFQAAQHDDTQNGRFTKVPSNLLGMVLDHKRASLYGAHLLAIKTCSASGGKRSPSTSAMSR
jgi:hypothetical protein